MILTKTKNLKNKGFTIVELLIVIVVLGILAALVLNSFSSAQSKSYDTAVKSDLKNFATTISRYKAETGNFPADLTASMGLKFNRSVYGLDFQSLNLRYCLNTSTDNFIIYAKSKSGNYFKYTQQNGLETASDTYGWGVCGQIGLVNQNPTYNGLSGTAWAAWVNE